MAGNSEMHSKVHKWLLDYAVHTVWYEFKKSGSIPLHLIDLISGLFELPLGKDDAGLCSVGKYFITVMCRVSDGANFNAQYSEESEHTVLEDMLPIFEKLVVRQPDNICKAGLDLMANIKKEAVLVCCRVGDFEAASGVFQRLWSKLKEDRNNKQTREMYVVLKTLVNGEVSEGLSTYSEFVKILTNYLQCIFNRFSTPMLLLAAEKFLQAKKEAEDGERPLQKSRFNSSAIERAIQPGRQETDQSGVSAKKQRILLSSAVGKLFTAEDAVSGQGAATNGENNNNQEQPSSSTHFAIPSSSVSPRKRSSPTKSIDTFKSPHPKETDAGRQRQQQRHNPAAAAGSASTDSDSTDSEEEVHSSKPTKESSSIQRDKTASKSPAYKKNQGRPDRHNPVANSTARVNGSDSEPEIDNISMISGISLSSTMSGTRRKWTNGEMEEFFDAVAMIGVGKWSKIRDYLNTARTSVMLKDKWRTMLKSGDAERLQRKKQKKK